MPLVIYGALCLGLVAAGALLHSSTRAAARQRGGAAIDAVAALKRQGIVRWRTDELDEVRVAASRKEVARVGSRNELPRAGERQEAERALADLARLRGYLRATVVTESGEVRAGVTGEGTPGPAPDLALVRRALAEGPSASLAVFPEERRPRLDLAVPIAADGRARAVLYVQVDGTDAVAAVVRGWPVPSDTGETVLAMRDGDDALFASEPRFLPGWAYKVRIPLREDRRGLVQALRGEGIFEGVDYRGTRVVIASRQVPDTALSVVARMDAEELEAPLVGPLNQLTVLVAFLLAVGAAGLVWVQRQERRHEEVLARARRELEASGQRLKLALAGTHWVWDWDLEGGGLSADPEWARSVGLPYHRVEGDLDAVLSRVVHPDDRPSVAERMGVLASGAAPSIEIEFRTRLPVGERWIRFRAGVSERGPEGGARKLIGVLSDVTDQRALQAQLERSERMASLGTLAAGVAHEINNPLTYVVANLEELETACAGRPELLEPVRQAREGVERVREVVRGLRSFSRGGSTRGPVDVAAELASALRIARNELSHRATLEVQVDPMPAVDAKGHALGQVFLNLLLNAGQALPEGTGRPGRVRVHASTDPRGRARVEIADDGVGIPPEVLPRIFEPFFTTKPVGVGTGLGLAIAHNVVTEAGGTIEVESQLGAGSTFRVLLPPAHEPSAPRPDPGAPVPGQTRPAPVDHSPPARASGGAAVLIVDDEPLVARSIARALQADQPVEVVTSAREACDRIALGVRYAAVVCDLMMPTMTGVDLHAWVADRDPELADRFLFITGGAFTQRSRDFLERTRLPWLEKPFDPERLREAVRAALRSPSR
jgi:signal transduction histidine kinase